MAAFRFDPAWIRCGSRHAIEFRHLGGIAMLMAVLRSFRKDLSFAIIYCGIVANLAVDLENQSDLVREGPRGGPDAMIFIENSWKHHAMNFIEKVRKIDFFEKSWPCCGLSART